MLIEQRSAVFEHICQCFAGGLGELIASLPFGRLVCSSCILREVPMEIGNNMDKEESGGGGQRKSIRTGGSLLLWISTLSQAKCWESQVRLPEVNPHRAADKKRRAFEKSIPAMQSWNNQARSIICL